MYTGIPFAAEHLPRCLSELQSMIWQALLICLLHLRISV